MAGSHALAMVGGHKLQTWFVVNLLCTVSHALMHANAHTCKAVCQGQLPSAVAVPILTSSTQAEASLPSQYLQMHVGFRVSVER